MTLGPILGNVKCPHESLVYYHGGYSGNYAVCQSCGGHLWGDSEDGIAIPPGVNVIDLDTDDDDVEDAANEPSYPIPTVDRLEAWKRAAGEWDATKGAQHDAK